MTDERTRREREARLLAIFHQGADCISSVDAHCRILDINGAGAALFGAQSVEELRGRVVPEMIAPEHRGQYRLDVARVFAGGGPVKSEFEVIGLRGGRRWVEHQCVGLEDSSNPGLVVEMLAVQRDTTDRRLQEARSIRSERREALATLTAGMAHEFNNTLLAAATYLHGSLVAKEPSIVKASLLLEQAQSLSASLMELFAGPETIAAPILMVETWLGGCVHHLASLKGPAIRVRTETAGKVGAAYADPVALEEVLGTLLDNASEALLGKGEIVVGMSAVRDEAIGPGVEIRVCDRGPGIPREDWSKTFEAFSTVRGRLRRSALGLAIASRRVEQWGGRVSFEPHPGGGSIFVVRLRAALARTP